MAKIITAPDKYHLFPSYFRMPLYSIFLAGAIDMGNAVNWQQDVCLRLMGIDNLVIFNPRRESFTPDTLDEQIQWELKYLNQVSKIFMWFPGNSYAPIALLETGLFAHSGRLIVGAEPEFYRRRNLEITLDMYGIHVHDNLSAMVQNVIDSIKEFEKNMLE